MMVILGIVAVGCVISALYIQMKFRLYKEKLDLERGKVISARVMILTLICIDSILFALLLAAAGLKQSDVLLYAENPLAFIVIPVILIIGALIKTMIAGKNLEGVVNESGSAVFSQTLTKMIIAEPLNFIGVIVFFLIAGRM